MAQTWGDIISRGYSMGRAIGNDFSEMRFSRKADQLRQEYEARAAEEGKPLESYVGEMEERLRDVARSSGATRRGIGARTGDTLDRTYRTGLREDIHTQGERRAWELEESGDRVGAYDSRARTQGALGNFDAGIQQRLASRTIGATQGAMRPDGTYDMRQGAINAAGVSAAFGDQASAEGNTQNAETFRLRAAAAKAGALFNIATNLDQFSNDHVRGTWAGLAEHLPEVSGTTMEKQGDSVLALFRQDGSSMGAWDMTDENDLAELTGFLQQFSSDPAASMQSYLKSQADAIAERKTQSKEDRSKFRDAAIEVVKGLTAQNVPRELSKSLVDARTGEGGSNGWKSLQDVGVAGNDPDQSGQRFLMEKGGTQYIVEVNREGPGGVGGSGRGFTVIDQNGAIVPPEKLNATDRSGIEHNVKAAVQLLQLGHDLNLEAVYTQLDMLDELAGQYTGQPRGPRSSRGGDGGRKFPIKETDDYVRNIMSQVGTPTGSSREVARQVMDALIQQESGGDHSAVSPKGARGITQVMPATGADPGYGVRPLQDESEAEYRRFGEDYLTAMLDRYDGDLELALAAYNAGPKRADEWAQQGPSWRSGRSPVSRDRAAAAEDSGDGSATAQIGPLAPTASTQQQGVLDRTNVPSPTELDRATPARATLSAEVARVERLQRVRQVDEQIRALRAEVRANGGRPTREQAIVARDLDAARSKAAGEYAAALDAQRQARGIRQEANLAELRNRYPTTPTRAGVSTEGGALTTDDMADFWLLQK